jgi:hypothetical protein
MKARRITRTIALVLTGGMLFQVTGCGTILAPVALGFGENLLLSLLLGGAF